MGGAFEDDLLDGLVFEFERRRERPPIINADDAARSTEVACDKILPVLDSVRPRRLPEGPAPDGSSKLMVLMMSSFDISVYYFV
jgi:hypothetical protein